MLFPRTPRAGERPPWSTTCLCRIWNGVGIRLTFRRDNRTLCRARKKLGELRKELNRRGSVAVTGQITQSLAVQGMAGVGKTVLTRMLAHEVGEHYPDGVFWEKIGPDIHHPDQMQPILRKWTGYATSFFDLPQNVQNLFFFEPDAVRALLSEHPRLLVVLDDVWDLSAVQPLRDALPEGTHLIITTRSHEIARGLGGGKVEVGSLTRSEAIKLFRIKLGWRPNAKNERDAWAFALMEKIERHALGLHVALGVLEREGGSDPLEWQASAQRILNAIRSGALGDLTIAHLKSHNVQAVLHYSYQALEEEAQRRFRYLGSFAPDALFTTDEAAAVWGCDADSARRTLVLFANAALIERQPGQRWQQHALLRGLALALLRQQGEGDRAAAAHARAYDEAMRAADDAQRYFELLPALPQLAHAFDWAAANDLNLALNIAANCANLQKQFGQTRQAGEWSERLLTAAQQGQAGERDLAQAYLNRANILSALATLAGEDRRGRLIGAIRCAAEAVMIFEQVQQAQYLAVGQRVLRDLRRVCAEDFTNFWGAAGLGDLPAWLTEDDIPDDPSTLMAGLLQAFVQIGDAEQMMEFWRALPAEVEEPFMQAVEALIAQASADGNADAVEFLRSRLQIFRQIHEAAAAASAIPPAQQAAIAAFAAQVQSYLAHLQAADADDPQVAAWIEITALGERLLAAEAAGLTGVDWSAMRQQIARDFNTLGNAHHNAGDKAASLAAFERAIELQPDEAMVHRNRAGTLIDLGRLDAARAALDQARLLEPDAPRLAQLEEQLAAAQEGSDDGMMG